MNRYSFMRWGAAALLAASTASVVAPHARAASPWNLATDFSTTGGFTTQSPPWAFGFAPSSTTPATLSGSFMQLSTTVQSDTDGTGNHRSFYCTSGGCPPVVGKATGPSSFTQIQPGVSNFIVPAGTVYVAPNGSPAANSQVVVRWTAPAAGTYTINASFQLRDTAVTTNGGATSDGVNTSIIESPNGAPGSATTLLGTSIAAGSSTPQTYSNSSLTLGAGDELFFLVDPKTNNLNDSTGLDVTITTNGGGGDGAATPELGSGELAAIGLLPIAFILYRRRSARP